MFKIAICDDEDIFIQELKIHLNRYAAETDRDFCYFVYHDGSEFLKRYNAEYDLIFMDIRMERLNGLKTAEAIRQTDSSVGLIFLTSFREYVWKGYEYRAVNYMLKPVSYPVLQRELDRYFARYRNDKEPYLVFSNDSGRYKVLYKDICHAETCRRNVLLHFDGGRQVIYKNMKEVSGLLCQHPQFAQCHRSFIVNLSYIRSVEGLELLLTTGERIPVSQPKRKKFMQRLIEYMGDQL